MTLPEPGSDEVLVRTLHSGISRGTETLVFAGRVPASQYQRMRAPFQDGELPGPVKYGYLNVGVVEHGPAELLGRTVFCLYPHQTAYLVPAKRGAAGPGRRAGPPGGAGRHRGDRGQRALGRTAADRRPDQRGRRRHGRLLPGPAAGRYPGRQGHPGRRRTRTGPRPPRSSASTSRCRRRRPASRTWCCTPARPPPACNWSLDLLADRGHRARAELVRRHRGEPGPGRDVPLRPAGDPGQPGRPGRAGPASQPHAAPTGWRWRWTCCATRPSTRC